MDKWLRYKNLEGNLIKLEPLSMDHKDAMVAAASDGELWNLWYTSIPRPEEVELFISLALDDYNCEKSLPFAVIDKTSNKVIGTTRYLNVHVQNRRLEVGHTWYAKTFQKTGVNTECKYLLLTYAFEVLDCIAVEFRTHWFNHASRQAIARLGAKQDGILRNHTVSKEGILRDTVVFSITKGEWPTVKKHLEYKMKQYR